MKLGDIIHLMSTSLLEYQLDWVEIVDFSLIAKFWACALFLRTPSIIGDPGIAWILLVRFSF